MTENPGEPSAAAAGGTVRPARPADAERIANIQVETWRAAYGGLLPASVLAELDVESAIEAWTAATSMPPTPRHHVLVAVDTATDTVAGFAALTPADDDDADALVDGEIAVLLVDEPYAGRGHGSRLLAACVDIMRGDGCTRALVWVLAQDDALRQLLVSAGWGTDGSHRTLDAGDGSDALRQLRLHTDLTAG